MRGPGVRLDLDVRRVWRCPQCHRERRLPGDYTAVQCTCAEGVWMQIVNERVAVQRPVVSAEARELTVESFQLTEEELATPLPGRVRRRGPNPRTDAPAGEPPNAPGPDRGPAGERGPRDSKSGGANESGGPSGGARKPRPPRPPKPQKRPLSDIAMTPDDPPRPEPRREEQPSESDDFSAGLDLPSTPSEG